MTMRDSWRSKGGTGTAWAVCALAWSFGCLVAGCEADRTDAGMDDGGPTDPGAEPAGCSAYAQPAALGTLPAGLDEVSGICASREPGILWMHNDSGSMPRIYAVDVASGTLLATVTIPVDVWLDWEDMSAGPCGGDGAGRCLYIGDIGDNSEFRDVLGAPPLVHRIAEPDPTGGDQTVTNVETMSYRYSDEVAHNAEAMVVDGQGRVYVLTKDEGDLFRLFGAAFSHGDEPVAMTDHGTFDISPWLAAESSKVTAADFDIARNRLLVRHWLGILEYVLPSGAGLASLQAVAPRVVPCAHEDQGEAAAYGDGGYYHVSEGPGSPIHFVACVDSP